MSGIKPLALALVILLFGAEGIAPAEQGKNAEGLKNYDKLHSFYIKWNDGFFGSRKYHEWRLKSYLRELIGKEITTDYEYMLVFPEGYRGQKIRCRMAFGTWLHIYGDIDEKSLKEFFAQEKKIMNRWWRTSTLIAVSGQVRGYRLDWDKYGDIVEIFLEKIFIIRQ